MNNMVLKHNEQDILRDEIDRYYCGIVGPKNTPGYIYEYLKREGIQTLYDIGYDNIYKYSMYALNDASISAATRPIYVSAIFRLIVSAYSEKYNSIFGEVDKVKAFRGRERFKFFLVSKGYHSMTQFDYEDREEFESIIKKTMGQSAVIETLVAIDNIKLASIVNTVAQNPLKKPKLEFAEKKINLIYHPDPQISLSIGRKAHKSNYLFDFSRDGSPVMKKQIFDLMEYFMYNDPADTQSKRIIRFRQHISPLREFLNFCCSEKIEDINYLDAAQKDLFISRFNDGEKKNASIMIYNVLKILMKIDSESGRFNWDANVWFTEFMKIAPERSDASNPISFFRFDVIKDVKSRKMVKIFAKYRIALTDGSIIKIRSELYFLHEFFNFCADHNTGFDDIDEGVVEEYLASIPDERSNSLFNNKLFTIYRMFDYLLSKGYVKSNPVDCNYYKRRIYFPHNNRLVGEEIIVKTLGIIDKIPLVERLMFLNLLCVGMRIGEMCELKGGAYFERNGETWMKIYQPKMRSEKVVPIPSVLYVMMQEYIKSNNIAADEYIFKNSKGGVYKSRSYRYRMKKIFQENGIEDYGYCFKAHDYRHTIASALYNNGASINSIRDYLGHTSSEMTKQYIDYVPDMVSRQNEQYFLKAGKLITSTMYDRYSLKLHIKDLPGYRAEMDTLRKGNRCYDLGRLPVGPIRSEFRNFIVSTASDYSPVTLIRYLDFFDKSADFLTENNIRSFHGIEKEKMLVQMKAFLMKKGQALFRKMKRYDQVYIVKNDCLMYLQRAYEFVNADDVPEYEKDIWNLEKMDINVRNNKANPKCSLNFERIRQADIKNELKRIVLMELRYKTVQSIVHEIKSVNYLSEFLEKEHPGVQSLCDLNRDIMEDYLIFMTAESGRSEAAKYDIICLKNIFCLAARLFEVEELKNLILYTDYRKSVKPVYKAYSDREIMVVNELYRQLDEQVGRVFILQQLLGCRISEALLLKQDCIVERKDMIYINIYQPKVSRTYMKPVNKEIKSLIEAAIEYTNTLYGPREYIFVRDKNPDEPMRYGFIVRHLREAIFQNDARMDNGEKFGIGTHLMRHAYGKRLTEMHLDDEIIAKLLGHSGTRAVANYRRMGDMVLADETREVRNMLNDLILRNMSGGKEDE